MIKSRLKIGKASLYYQLNVFNRRSRWLSSHVIRTCPYPQALTINIDTLSSSMKFILSYLWVCSFKHPAQSHRALGPAPSCQGRRGAAGAAGRGAADEKRRAQGCSLWSDRTATARGPEGQRRAPPRCCRPDASAALWRKDAHIQNGVYFAVEWVSCLICTVVCFCDWERTTWHHLLSVRADITNAAIDYVVWVSFTGVDLVEGLWVQAGSYELENSGQRTTS